MGVVFCFFGPDELLFCGFSCFSGFLAPLCIIMHHEHIVYKTDAVMFAEKKYKSNYIVKRSGSEMTKMMKMIMTIIIIIILTAFAALAATVICVALAVFDNERKQS